MDNSIWGMLNEAEKELLRDAEPRKLAELDEDDLAALHDRIRRARNKYSKLYRRRAASQVSSDAGRKKAHAQHARTLVKAEAFEETLAVVSQHLARAARASAKELKAERIAAARAAKAAASGRGTPDAPASVPKTGRSRGAKASRTPASERSTASARATTRRAQAKKDSR